MTDIALEINPSESIVATLFADAVIEDNGLVVEDDITTAVILSIFVDARAGDGDVIPDGTTDRRGWWGDEFEDDGESLGSKLWLLDRGKQIAGEDEKAEKHVRNALQWMLDDGIVQSVSVVVSSENGIRKIAVSIERLDGSPVLIPFVL
jgi:phage gp46-like protein